MALEEDEQGFEHFCTKHYRFNSTPMKTPMPIDRIQARAEDSFISCHGDFVGHHSSKHRIFSFISGKWANLMPKLQTKDEFINLFETPSHLESLMPTNRKAMHLVTYQNGIQNTPNDFRKMGEGISTVATQVFGHVPLCIGFYNPTTGNIGIDTLRALLRYMGVINRYIVHTTIWFETLLTLLKRNPNLRWMHITHSEGGAIAYLALKMLLLRKEKYNTRIPNLSERLILSAFGPLHPVPKTLISKSYNIYNCQDRATLRFGANFMDPKTEAVLRPGYDNISIEHSDKRSILAPGDHSFLGGTYEDLLSENLKLVRDKVL